VRSRKGERRVVRSEGRFYVRKWCKFTKGFKVGEEHTSSRRLPHVRNARFPNRCGVGRGGMSSIQLSILSSIWIVLITAYNKCQRPMLASFRMIKAQPIKPKKENVHTSLPSRSPSQGISTPQTHSFNTLTKSLKSRYPLVDFQVSTSASVRIRRVGTGRGRMDESGIWRSGGSELGGILEAITW
jgi:hypothetical protein